MGVHALDNPAIGSDDAASFDLECWEKHVSVNLRAPRVFSCDFAGQLPDETEGAIVNIIDQLALRPPPRLFTYGLSKSALWAATWTLAQAFAPKGIRVNRDEFFNGTSGFLPPGLKDGLAKSTMILPLDSAWLAQVSSAIVACVRVSIKDPPCQDCQGPLRRKTAVSPGRRFLSRAARGGCCAVSTFRPSPNCRC